MKLLTADFALDCIEFVDRYGIFRTAYGCSLFGVEEFQSRLAALEKLMETASGEATIAKLYKHNALFRHHCDRALQLNGVDPDWLDHKGLILEGLLFLYEGNVGLLIRLNSPEPKESPAAATSDQVATVYDVGATLLGLSNDLSKVLEQLNTLPAKQVGRILEARAAQVAAADPEEKQKQSRKDWAAKMRDKGKGRVIAVPNDKPTVAVS